jgi:rubrerythrin
MPIDTVEDLQDHLQLAISVELATIPPYLYALYSIEDPASVAAKYIRSVATEEMLHAVLMANILLGVGGEPRFYDREVMPVYPGPWPNRIPELILHLERCTPEMVETTFLGIEAPGRPEAPDQPDRYESQGQFYHALEQAIRRLAETHDLFANPRPDRQLHDPNGYVAVKYDDSSSGGLIVVDSLEAALAATEVAIHQGEGVHEERYADPGHRESTHYAKFLSLVDGTVDLGATLPVVTDPAIADMPANVKSVAEFANALYAYSYVLMDRVMAPDRADRHEVVALLYGVMVALLGPVGRYLMTLPAGPGRVWGPTFEFHEFAEPEEAEDELRAMGVALAADHPALAPVLRHLDRFEPLRG